MATKRVPAEVDEAMARAKKAGWDVAIRDAKVIITAPDGVAITIGLSPNDMGLRKWRAEAKRYNLYGANATPMTPAQQVELKEQAEAEGLKAAEAANKRRKALDEETAAKRKAVEEAKRKAHAATMNGMFKEPVIPAPAKAMDVTRDADGFPVFDESLLGRTGDSNLFLLPNGQYYCVECLKDGVKAAYNAPQGLAGHRGVKHSMYLGNNSVKETPRVQLPEDVDVAFELLRSSLAEHLSTDANAEEIRKLQTELTEVKRDIRQSEEAYKKLKTASEAAIHAEQAKTHAEQARTNDLRKELTKALATLQEKQTEIQQAKERSEEETSTLLRQFQDALKKIREALETNAPLQAIGAVDTIVKGFGV